MKTKTTAYDTAGHLRTPLERALYLEAHIEESGGDPYWIAVALSTIARSVGMTAVSRKAKLSRESLYKSLSGTRSPEFSTIVKVMTALGLRFRVVALPAPREKREAAPRTSRKARVLAVKPALKKTAKKATKASAKKTVRKAVAKRPASKHRTLSGSPGS